MSFHTLHFQNHSSFVHVPLERTRSIHRKRILKTNTNKLAKKREKNQRSIKLSQLTGSAKIKKKKKKVKEKTLNFVAF